MMFVSMWFAASVSLLQVSLLQGLELGGQSSDTASHVHEHLLQSCYLGLQTCYQGSKFPKLRECSPVQLSQATHPANVVLQDSAQRFVRERGPRRRNR